MGTQSLLDVMENGEFAGNWTKLRDLIRSENCSGKWRDLGDVKRFSMPDFSPFTRLTEIYFWPATGKVLTCQYWDDPPMPQTPINWKTSKYHGGSRSARWATYKFAGIGRASLPEIVFREPEFYFEGILCERPPEIDPFEHAEIADKVAAIRIPCGAAPNTKVIHDYDLCDHGEYLGFELTKRPIILARPGGGLVGIANHIDLTHARWSFYADGNFVFESPIPSLMNVLAGKRDRKFDRSECEAFFDDPRNFVPIRGAFQPEETPYSEAISK